eukprot:5596000-Prymnesium_polylepis.1
MSAVCGRLRCEESEALDFDDGMEERVWVEPIGDARPALTGDHDRQQQARLSRNLHEEHGDGQVEPCHAAEESRSAVDGECSGIDPVPTRRAGRPLVLWQQIAVLIFSWGTHHKH